MITMLVYKIKRKSVAITLTEEEYRFIEDQIWENHDTIRTVPGYIRRLVRHYIWFLRTEAEIQKNQKHLKRLQKGQEGETDS